MPPIALTDAQLAMITAAAKPLHACDRTPFLEAVAAARLHGVEIGDGVVRETQRSFFRAPVLDADNSTTTTTKSPSTWHRSTAKSSPVRGLSPS